MWKIVNRVIHGEILTYIQGLFYSESLKRRVKFDPPVATTSETFPCGRNAVTGKSVADHWSSCVSRGGWKSSLYFGLPKKCFKCYSSSINHSSWPTVAASYKSDLHATWPPSLRMKTRNHLQMITDVPTITQVSRRQPVPLTLIIDFPLCRPLFGLGTFSFSFNCDHPSQHLGPGGPSSRPGPQWSHQRCQAPAAFLLLLTVSNCSNFSHMDYCYYFDIRGRKTKEKSRESSPTVSRVIQFSAGRLARAQTRAVVVSCSLGFSLTFRSSTRPFYRLDIWSVIIIWLAATPVAVTWSTSAQWNSRSAHVT